MHTEGIDKFIKDGKIVSWPSPKNNDLRLELYQYMKQWFEPNKEYPEVLINMIIKKNIACMDHAFFRRELVDHGILNRTKDGLKYILA